MKSRDDSIVELRRQGMSTRAIASTLGISDSTVRRTIAGMTDPVEFVVGLDGRRQYAIRESAPNVPKYERDDRLIGKTQVYRFYDQLDCLLYVGITSDFGSRLKTHWGEKPWMSDVARIELKHFNSRADARREERAAILSESPKYNHPGR